MFRHYLSGFGGIAMLVLAAGPLHAATGQPVIEKQASIHAAPARVSLVQVDGSIYIQGELRRLAGSPSRRLGGKVRIEALDSDGQTLFVRHADVSRTGPSKHTARGRFSIYVEELKAEDISRLKVGYSVGKN
jgi:hypothetical protein